MKKTIIYEVEEHRGEIRDWRDVKPCCVMDSDNWLEPHIIGKYATKEEAYEELKKHMPTCDRQYTHLGWIYIVTEYVVEKHYEDENGEFVEGSDYDYLYDYRWDDETQKIIVEKL